VKATVSSIEQAFTSSGAEYKKLKVTDENGKETTKTVFDNLQDKWPLLTEGAYLDFKMEKRGQFWNVIDISPINVTPLIDPQLNQDISDEIQANLKKENEPPLVTEAKKLNKEAGEMSKTDWAIKDALTRKSIERQKSLDKAVDCFGPTPNEYPVEDIITQAQRFERYIETGK